MNGIDMRVLKRFFPSRLLPRWLVLFLDLGLVAVSVLLSYVFRYDFSSEFLGSPSLGHTLLLALAANLVAFAAFRSYANVIRFSTSCGSS